MKVGVAGGGIIGSLLAWRIAKTGATVEVFDAGDKQRCSSAAAGMLSPVTELATAPPSIGDLGKSSLQFWNAWLQELNIPQALVQRGSLLTALDRDTTELERLVQKISAKISQPEKVIISLNRAALTKLEPALSHLPKAYFLPSEGHLNTDTVLATLRTALDNAGVSWYSNVQVSMLSPHKLSANGTQHHFDWVCDSRGIGANESLSIRPVRGEIIHLTAPAITISRPVHVAHPRYPIYILPRGPRHYLVGATEIESNDSGNICVRSILELLSTVYRLHAGFADAQLKETRIGLRPAFPDNIPQLTTEPGLVSINGMYRYGFLAGPALVAKATEKMGLTA